MTILLAAILLLQAPTPEGVWAGIVEAGAMKLRLVLRIVKSPDGSWSAKMDSVDQGAFGMVADSVKPRDGAIRVSFQQLGASFDGKLMDEGRVLTGEWTQRGVVLPLKFLRTTEAALSQAPARGRPMTDDERAFAIANLERTQNLLLESIKGVSAEQARFKPAADRWSVLDCVEHLALIEDFLFGYVRNNVLKIPPSADAVVKTPGELRVADDKVLASMTDRSKKGQTPEVAKPTGAFVGLQEAADAFVARRTKVIEYVRSTDEDLRNHAINNMDGYQYLLVLAGHAERHTLQLKEVKASPGYPK